MAVQTNINAAALSLKSAVISELEKKGQSFNGEKGHYFTFSESDLNRYKTEIIRIAGGIDVPDEILSDLSVNERRALVGYPPWMMKRQASLYLLSV